MNSSDWIAAASLGVAAAALGISIYAIHRANKTASAATLVTLNEGFRQAWERCLQTPPTPDAPHYDLAELLNLLEIACAIYLEKSFTGNSGRLMSEYLQSTLSLLIKTPVINDEAFQLLQTAETFMFIKKFLKEKPTILSVTIPPKWYELQPYELSGGLSLVVAARIRPFFLISTIFFLIFHRSLASDCLFQYPALRRLGLCVPPINNLSSLVVLDSRFVSPP